MSEKREDQIRDKHKLQSDGKMMGRVHFYPSTAGSYKMFLCDSFSKRIKHHRSLDKKADPVYESHKQQGN
jgi:hypothetical protein